MAHSGWVERPRGTVRPMACTFVIFGGYGDLTGRFLLPAVAHLRRSGDLPDGFRVVATARRDSDTDRYREWVAERLERHAGDLEPNERAATVELVSFEPADAADPDDVARVLAGAGDDLIAYLALPPAVYGPAIEALERAGLPAGTRLVVEKPFGESEDHARELNALVHRALPEEAVFRVDHFLGKQTVQNLVGLRFANRILEPVWNRDHIEAVDVVWDETLALEGRASYYDGAGALVDMVQNHLLQLLALLAMEPPATLDERDLRDRKYDVLRAVAHLDAGEVERSTVRGRYTAGEVDGRAVPAYVEEEGVDPGRGTETFAQVRLTVENWRWAGVPFTLRTGKALAADRREVVVRFRPVPHLAFCDQQPHPNELRLQLGPDRVALRLTVNGPGDPFSLRDAELDTDLGDPGLPAYATVLREVLVGNPILSIRGDEAEESWRIVEPVLAGWRAGRVPLQDAPAGSAGPAAAGSLSGP